MMVMVMRMIMMMIMMLMMMISRQFHCSIQVSPTSFVLTGGLDSEDFVTQYSDIDGPDESHKEVT